VENQLFDESFAFINLMKCKHLALDSYSFANIKEMKCSSLVKRTQIERIKNTKVTKVQEGQEKNGFLHHNA
jgi:hypothetical protein